MKLCSEIYEVVGKVMENGELIAAGLRCKPVALNDIGALAMHVFRLWLPTNLPRTRPNFGTTRSLRTITRKDGRFHNCHYRLGGNTCEMVRITLVQ